MEEGNRLMEEAVRAVARQLEEIVRLQGERMARLEDRMARLEGKSGNVESLKGTGLDCLPPMEDVPVTNAKEGEKTNTGGINFPPEEWKVIDENWESLKDAVYRKKVKKETLPYDSLPPEAWRVLDKNFDELARLFHI